jgi:hypothetical protein
MGEPLLRIGALSERVGVVSSTPSERPTASRREIIELAHAVPEPLARKIGATLLEGDPITAAEGLAA